MPIQLLKQLTNKKHIILTKSGNQALKEVIKLFPKKTFLIQQEGGWYTYKQFPKQIQEIKTTNCNISLTDLKNKANSNTILLINSLSAYSSPQPMEKIKTICKEKSCLIINDVSASIGTEIAKIGDFIVGSFGKAKPIDLEYGGFIASNKLLKIIPSFNKQKLLQLKNKLLQLPKRLNFLYSLSEKVKKELNFKIYNKKQKGLNVITEFNQEIIDYCNKNNYEYFICPNYIKINKKAISIELKRCHS